MDFVPPSLPEQIALGSSTIISGIGLAHFADHLVAASHRFMVRVIFVYGDDRDVFISVVRGLWGFKAFAMRETCLSACFSDLG